MKGKIALALVALAAGIAACGDAEESEPLATVGPPTMTSPARSPPSDPRRPCARQGIDGRTLNEGTCAEGTTLYVVANRDGTLRLDSLVASIDGMSVEREIGEGDTAVQPQQGAFLKVSLTVENPHDYRQRFETGQTILGVGDDTFRESEEAEQAHPGALATKGDGQIEAGETLRGDVIFDMPPETIERISSTGRFFIANFGERPGERRELTPAERQEQQIASAIGASIVPPTQLGQVRLYAGAAEAGQ